MEKLIAACPAVVSAAVEDLPSLVEFEALPVEQASAARSLAVVPAAGDLERPLALVAQPD